MTAPTWWFDLTTLHKTLSAPGRRPTGIHRVAIEYLLAARQDPEAAGRIRLCRHDAKTDGIVACGWEELDALLANTRAAPRRARSLRQLAQGLPPGLHARIGQMEKDLKRRAAKAMRGLRGMPAPETIHPFADGDVWVNLGCWWHADLPRRMEAIRGAGLRLRTAVMIHDCMPLIFPEFFPRLNIEEWQDGIAPLKRATDVMLVSSAHTAGDLARVMPDFTGRAAQIRFGDSFDRETPDPAAAAAARARLGVPENYVLLVGTIEARKNHALAFRAWRSMALRGVENLPTLVFAGKWGWKSRDLAEMLADSRGLEGRAMVVDGPSDAELDALYAGARFTLFPSLYEGWGLPIRESLHARKLCIAARNSALVEAGGDAAIYFESDSQEALIAAATPLCEDAALAAAEAAHLPRFAPVPWAEGWETLKAALRAMEEETAR